MSPQTDPATTSNPPSSSSSAPSSRPKVTLPPSSHLDPGAYVRGSHPIAIGEDTVIHPRAHLLSIHAPLNIGAHCIISERSLIGGPLPSTSSSASANTSTNSYPDKAPDVPPKSASSGAATTIASHVHIHPHAHISHSTTIHSYAVIEAHSTVSTGLTIGAHSKICSNVTLDRDVPPWTVVFGNGELRRSRLRSGKSSQSQSTDANANGNGDGAEWDAGEDQVEAGRVKLMDSERHATKTILQNAARAASLARKK